MELLNFHLGYLGNSVIIADRCSMYQSILSTNIYPLSNPRDPDSLVELSWRQDFCIEIYGHQCNLQDARLRVNRLPLGFHWLVTMDQTPATRVIKPHQGVKPEHVLSLEIKSFLCMTGSSDLVLTSLLDDVDVRRSF